MSNEVMVAPNKLLSDGIQQPYTRIARMAEIVRITGRSKTMIYEDIKDGRFPAGFLIGKRARGWLLSDVMAWLESCKTGG